MPRRTEAAPASRGRAPGPWLVGASAFAVASAFKVLPLDWAPWLYASLALSLELLAILGVSAWSQQRGWANAHRLALAAGPLLTYVWSAFPQPPILPASPSEDLIGNAAFAIATVALLVVAAVRQHRQPNDLSHAAREPKATSRAA